MDSGLETNELYPDRKMTVEEQEKYLMEALNWMTFDEIDKNKNIREAEEDVDKHFVLFYIAYRKAELLKKNKSPSDENDIDTFDDFILDPIREDMRKDLYRYIGESLLEFLSKECIWNVLDF